MLQTFKTHDKEITAEVVRRLIAKLKSPTWTQEAWNLMYEIVWTEHAIDTMAWKHENGFPA